MPDGFVAVHKGEQIGGVLDHHGIAQFAHGPQHKLLLLRGQIGERQHLPLLVVEGIADLAPAVSYIVSRVPSSMTRSGASW